MARKRMVKVWRPYLSRAPNGLTRNCRLLAWNGLNWLSVNPFVHYVNSPWNGPCGWITSPAKESLFRFVVLFTVGLIFFGTVKEIPFPMVTYTILFRIIVLWHQAIKDPTFSIPLDTIGEGATNTVGISA